MVRGGLDWCGGATLCVRNLYKKLLGQRRDGERGGKRGDGDGLDVLEPEGLGVGEDEADGSGREGTHGEAEGVRAVERRERGQIDRGDEERGAGVARRPEADPAFRDGLVREVELDDVVRVDVRRNLRANLGPTWGVVFGRVMAVLCRAKLARSVARVRIDMSLCRSTVTTMNWQSN